MKPFLEANRRRIYWVFTILIFIALIWFFFLRTKAPNYQTVVVHAANFAEELSVSGTVIAAQNVDLGFSQGGRISSAYGAVGDTVREGSLLAEVENGDLRAVVSQKIAALSAQQANLNALLAGTRQEQLAVTQAQIDSDTSALSQANQGIATSIQTAYTTSDDAVHNKIDQFFSNPRGSFPQLSFTVSDAQLQTTTQNDRVAVEAMLVAWQKNVATLSGAGDLTGQELAAENNLAQVTKILSDANASLNAAITNQTTTQAVLMGYITNVASARASINAAVAGLNTAVSVQKNASATLQKDIKNLALEQAGATQQSIEQARAQVTAAGADVQNAQAQLVKTQIVAPFTGEITKMDAKRGVIASPNTPLISMISKETFQIESFVPEVDIAVLKIGNTASTSLDAYGPKEFFAAKVISIDPAQTKVNGVSTYKTTLVFSKNDSRIKPGMTANVIIATGIVPQSIVVPKGAVYDVGTDKHVQVLVAKKAVVKTVQTSPTSLGSVIVTSGLAEGDTVILNPDTTK